ncbi:MAG: enoyl-CoA hydratase family protein [Pseudomonadota bacterium]
MTLARVDERDRCLVVVNMNAQKRGALSPDLYAAIQEAAARAKDPKIRAIVLSSEGGYFCAGGDLTVLIERRGLPEEERREKIEHLHDVIRALRDAPVPVVAAVEGGAAGAGVSIALACDFVVASEDAHFVAAYVKAGLVPDGGLTASLARLVPKALAMEMCVLAEPVSAQRLAALGVVNRIVPTGAAEEQALALAARIATGPRQAQAAIRDMVHAAYDSAFDAQLATERDAMTRATGGDEAAEGIAAFLEKRRPAFP